MFVEQLADRETVGPRPSESAEQVLLGMDTALDDTAQDRSYRRLHNILAAVSGEHSAAF